jgi:hypothetical protein
MIGEANVRRFARRRWSLLDSLPIHHRPPSRDSSDITLLMRMSVFGFHEAREALAEPEPGAVRAGLHRRNRDSQGVGDLDARHPFEQRLGAHEIGRVETLGEAPTYGGQDGGPPPRGRRVESMIKGVRGAAIWSENLNHLLPYA